MRKIKALVPFCGTVTMAPGEVREIDDAVAADLIHCGYAIAADDTPAAKPAAIKKGKKAEADA